MGCVYTDTCLTIPASEAKHYRDRQARVDVNATGYTAENLAAGQIFGGVVVKPICRRTLRNGHRIPRARRAGPAQEISIDSDIL